VTILILIIRVQISGIKFTFRNNLCYNRKNKKIGKVESSLHIHITENAAFAIESTLAPGPYRLQLLYDTDGCGCAVNGIAQLWAVDESAPVQPEIATVTSDHPTLPITVVYELRHEVFFEDKLTIDFDPAYRAFVIKSTGQYYNPRAGIVDRRMQYLSKGD
jgi:uncharacterized protein YqkB